MKNTASPAALAVATLGLVACGGGPEPRGEGAGEVVRAPVARVEVIERVREVELFGTVEADRQAAVSARVLAMVTGVRVREGEDVVRGQVLVDIDPQTAEGQLAQARGALAQARAALVLAERNLARYEALAATDAASQLELDTARMQHAQALGAVEQAEGAERAAASVAADARVTAPFDARVARRMAEVGDLAAPGRPLVVLESRRGRRLAVEVPESVAGRSRLAVGDQVPVAIDTRPDLGWLEGEVVEAAAGVDPRSHTQSVRIGLPLADVATGSAGRARIATGREPAVVAPRGAVIERGGLTLAVIRTAEGRAATRAVTVGSELPGEDAGGRVEILSGLDGGETVLLGLAAPPPAGARVEVLSAGPESGAEAEERR